MGTAADPLPTPQEASKRDPLSAPRLPSPVRRGALILLSLFALFLAGIFAAIAMGDIGPTTSVLDGFNRADGTLGANWSNTSTCELNSSPASAMALVSNHATDSGTTNGSVSCWLGASFGADQEAYATVVDSTSSVGLELRSNGAGLSLRCYMGGVSTWNIGHSNGSSGSAFVVDVTRSGDTLSPGDSIYCAASGRVVTFYWKASASSVWTAEASIVQTAVTGGGHIGMFSRSTNGILDDFGGGNYVLPGAVSTSTVVAYTGQATVTQAGAYTGQATVTVGGGGGTGVDCTIATNPCIVDISQTGIAGGYATDIRWGVAITAGVILFLVVVGVMNRTFGRKN